MTDDLRERVAIAIEGIDTSTVEGARAAADAAIAEMGGVRVKPLVWVDTSQSFLGERYSAQTIFGVEYVILWDDRAMTWSGFIWGQWTDYGDEGGFQKAKAAAQADYEARVLAALEPAPVSVREAARVLLGSLESPLLAALDPFNNDADVAQDVLDALRALAEGQEDDESM